MFKYKKDGWTDCHVFDFCRAEGSYTKAKNLSEGVKGKDVWPFTKLAEKMVHRKGNRKVQKPDEVKQKKEPINVLDTNNLQIKTKNCLDHKKIVENVNKNLSQIRHWATLCNPNEVDLGPKTSNCGTVNTSKTIVQQPIVICSAGPSLSSHIEEIREKQKEGAKIIAVKHALETLKAHDIKPWACVLLDPL